MNIAVDMLLSRFKSEEAMDTLVSWFGLEPCIKDHRFWWRYPVWDEVGTYASHRRYAPDGEMPRSQWDGVVRSDVLYNAACLQEEQPAFVVGSVHSVWLLWSLGIPAVTFLCSASARLPVGAVQAIVRARPAFCLAIDEAAGLLPEGASGVAQFLREVGLQAGALNLPATGMPRGYTVADVVAGCAFERTAVLDALRALHPVSRLVEATE